jgi:hypothetical protein
MAIKKLDFNVKDKLISLSGTCFWYWNNLYSFLESCGIPASVYKQFGKEGGKYQLMRSVLELLERQGKYDLIKTIAVQFYNLIPSDDGIDLHKANKQLDEYKAMVGTSLIEEEVNKREIAKKREEQKKISAEKGIYKNKLQNIKERFLTLHASEDKQKRGYELEALFFDLLELEEFEFHRPYKSAGEQIDGHFRYEKFDYIVEIKWTESVARQPDLSIFDGKIKGKGQSTRGFFVSISGFDNNSVSKFSNDSPKIMFMDGQDLFMILEERTTFYDMMKFKADAFARKGDIYAKQ